MTSKTCLISFPKSGRTWLRRILGDLGIDPEHNHAGASYNEGQHFAVLSTAAAENWERILLLVRDPRDTAVSGYHWLRTNIDRSYSGTLGEFIRDPRFGVEKVARFNLMWAELEREGLLVLTYEGLQADPIPSVARATAFLGSPKSDGEISRAVENNTFSEMQKREMEKVTKRLKKAGGGQPDINSFKARRGKVGGYRHEMSERDRLFCENLLDALNYFERIRFRASFPIGS